MALYSAKTWVGISSYNSWFVFSAQNTIGNWDFHRETFIVRPSFTAHLHDISIHLCRLKVKGITGVFNDRHSSNINNVFCGLRINTKNITLHKYNFGILYWHVNFNDLNTIKGVWNITKKRCESVPNNKCSPLRPWCVGKIMKLYDEMPIRVLAEYKVMLTS